MDLNPREGDHPIDINQTDDATLRGKLSTIIDRLNEFIDVLDGGGLS